MAYVQPTFNLIVGIYTNTGNFLTKVFRGSTGCQLRGPQQGPRVGLSYDGNFIDVCSVPLLLLPKDTDIRDHFVAPAGWGDIVEVPAGSGRWYIVFYVDDIGKGFTNEHRYAMLAKPQAPMFPSINVPKPPVPLP